jgi:hypothetical protein
MLPDLDDTSGPYADVGPTGGRPGAVDDSAPSDEQVESHAEASSSAEASTSAR